MNRRKILRRTAFGVNVALAGCLNDMANDDRPTEESPSGSSKTGGLSPTMTDSNESSTNTPTDTSSGTVLNFETRYSETTGQVLKDGIGGDTTSDHYATVMSTDAETERFDMAALDEEVTEFIEKTSFPGEVLLVAQRDLPSINLELDLEWVRIENNTLTARVETIHDYIQDASTNATLIARLDLDGHAIPEGGTVTFVDRHGEQTVVEIDYTEKS